MVYEKTQQGMILRVRLTPNSSCCKINGVFVGTDGAEWLKINVVSVPEKGKANQELLKFLSGELKIAKSAMTIVSGKLDRYKKILIENADAKTEAWVQGVLK